MPVETYEVREGQRIDVPSGDAAPGAATPPDATASRESAAPGATPETPAGSGEPPESPPGTPSGGEGESPPDTDDDDAPLRDESEVTAERLNRRFARLTAARRKAERERDALAQQSALELAQTRGQLEMVQRLLQGNAPPLPETPAPPTGPPQAEQFASHDEYLTAKTRYEAQGILAQDRQRQQQEQFQQALVAREQAFKAHHADYDDRVRAGLAGKVQPHVQQALMVLPDGPAIAYALAAQPDLVQRLNTLPPPLVFAELGRLSPAPATGTTETAPPTTTGLGPTATSGSARESRAQLPAPPSPLSGQGAGTPTGTFREDMSQAEYKAWRQRTSALSTWKDR